MPGGEWNRYAYTTAGRDAPSRLNPQGSAPNKRKPRALPGEEVIYGCE